MRMLLLLIGFGLFFVLLTAWVYRDRAISVEELLAAGRDVGFWGGTASLLATWTAPAAFLISAQVSYQMGFPGLFWFTVPNVLALVVFAMAAGRIKQQLPQGYTISQLFGARSRRLYGIVTVLTFLKSFLSLVSFVVGGAAFLEYFSALGTVESTGVILLILLMYSSISGLGASILTDMVQMAIIGVLVLVFVPWTLAISNGINLVASQISFDSAAGIFELTTLFFGLNLSVFLLTSPFVSQFIWQRVYAIEETEIKRSFLASGLIFAIIPISFGAMGLIAASARGITIDNPVLAGYVTMQSFLPVSVSMVVFLMLVGALLSSGDSALVATASIITTDLVDALLGWDLDEKVVMRGSMLIVAIIIGFSTLLPFSFLDWLLFNAPIGAVLIVPILATLYTEQELDASVLFYSIVLGSVISFPIYVYGSLTSTNSIQFGALVLGLVGVSIPVLLNIFGYIGTSIANKPPSVADND